LICELHTFNSGMQNDNDLPSLVNSALISNLLRMFLILNTSTLSVVHLSHLRFKSGQHLYSTHFCQNISTWFLCIG